MSGKVAAMPVVGAPVTAKSVARTRSAASARTETTTTTATTASRGAANKGSLAKASASKSSTSSGRPTTSTAAAASSSAARSTSTTSTRASASSSRTPSASKTSTTSAKSTMKTAPATASSTASVIRTRITPTQSATKAGISVSKQLPASIEASWNEAEVLATLASPRSCPAALPHFVLLLLGSTAADLELATELDSSPSFASPPQKLTPARSVYFAKQLVNAGLAFFTELVTSSWSASANDMSSEVPHVLAAVNTFRIATRFLLSQQHASASKSSGKQKELEIETVILRTCSKLKTLGFTNAARAECQHLERLLVGMASVAPGATATHNIFLPPFQDPSDSISRPSPTRISFLVDLQCNSSIHALETADLPTLDSILADLNDEHGPLAWQLYGRRHGGEVRVLDRAAFATERSISKALQRLEAPNNEEHLPLRTLALQLLVQVSDIDLTAFWERVARTGGAVLKAAQSQGEDVASVYHTVQDTFETILATAANVAENSEAKTKLQGEGFQRFCEYWLSFARKAGSSVGIELATAAMSSTSSSARAEPVEVPIDVDDMGPSIPKPVPSSELNPSVHLTDAEIAKICAGLTASVLALDRILTGKCEEGTQAKLDDSARMLMQRVAAWPVTTSTASQLKLYRVLDQLHRRCCSKLSNQGCDSKGQPKVDPTAPANVEALSRACLQLLGSLLEHSQAPAFASSSASDPAAKSTPSRTATLPSKDVCLADIVYGYRVLANKVFSATSRSARDEALSELKNCRDILLTNLAQSIPKEAISEHLRLLSTSFYNPAGILYNAANYVEAAEFLQLAVDCDHDSIQLLESEKEKLSASAQQELDATLIKRRESLAKKIEYTAVAYRFAGSKSTALEAYRRLLCLHAAVLGHTLDRHAGIGSIEDAFKKSDIKGLSGAIKAVVDLSVYELSLDMDHRDQQHSLVRWLMDSTEILTSVKGAILEHCAVLMESRSHLSNAVRAISNVQQALLQIYDAAVFPLRRARTLARTIEADVLSHALVLSEDEATELEQHAIACLDSQAHGKDEGLLSFEAQYRCSILLSTALHARLRKPLDSPQAVVAQVELACNGLSSSFAASLKAAQPTTPQTASNSPKIGSVTPAATPGSRGVPRKAFGAPGRSAATRKALAQRSAPSQAIATPTADPTTPPSRTGKLVLDAAASSLACRSPLSHVNPGARRLDRPQQFCQSLLTYHEAFSALALTRCSVQILRVVRQASRQGAEVVPGLEELFCRASADLSLAYLALGKPSRAESVLRSATSVLSRCASPKSPSSKLLLISQDVRFRCLMAQTQLLIQERDVVAAQTRLAEGVKLAKAPSKIDKSASSSMERLRQREAQAMAFSAYAQVQLARGDLAASIESTTLALRQLIRLSSNLSHIASKMQTSVNDTSQDLHSNEAPPSSDLVMGVSGEKQKQAEEQQLPIFFGSTFSSLFWRCCGLLLDNYTRLSQLHRVRGSAIDAEAMAGEAIDFATSLRFALPLARALIQRGEVRLQLNKTEQGQEDLSRCLEILQDTWIPEVVSLSYVQGDCLMRIEQLGEALRSYAAGEATLRTLSSTFAETEQVLASPMPKTVTHQRKKPSLSSPSTHLRGRLSNGIVMDSVLPELQSRLLQRQAWILHLLGESQRSEQAVEKAATIRDGLATVDARVEQFVVEGKIALRRALDHLKNDHFFSMLPEAAISIPMVPSVSVRALVAAAGPHQTLSEDTVKKAIAMLAPADSAFREALSLGLLSSPSLVLRDAFASLAQVYTTQAALGKNVKMAANAAAGLLDWASSVGVRRNLLVAISSKLRSPNALTDDQEWPDITTGDVNQDTVISRTQSGGSMEAEEMDEAEALPTKLAKMSLNGRTEAAQGQIPARSSPFSTFWQSVRLRHRQAEHESASSVHLLPRNWTVISISVRNSGVENLVLTRQEGGGGADGCTAKEAVLYSLPMNRRSQRDGTEEEEEQLTLEAAQAKVVEIVRLSNDGIHGVKDVQSMEARREWWTERHRLDDELRDLLQSMQDTWLGGFKGVFSDPSSDARATVALRARFEKIIRRACFPTANKRPAKLKLDDAVFECFAGLPADCTDEDLEDLVHYVMDALQFSGFQVAVDEIDLDETAMDLRGALEEFNGKKAQSSPNKPSMAYVAVDEEEQVQDHHIFLVLDKDTAMFPWESMPILRNKAVSRIPSMAFLQDRIELAKVFGQKVNVEQDDLDDQETCDLDLSPLQKGKHAARSALRSLTKASRTVKASTLGNRKDSPADIHSKVASSDSAWQTALRNGKLFSLSQRKTFYLLNPGGDLVQSQDRFEPWLKQRGGSHGWKGIVGRQPIVDELPDALSSSDLVLYFGHGGAEQFIRQSKVRELQRCAVAMLWGCSSAMLHDNGDYDRTGTPLNYMCAGAPAMVGNLWDMTDRELDSVCEGVFGRLGLMEARERAQVKPAARNIKLDRKGNLDASRGATEMSLARAVAESRNDCRLPYLTGAATVVYGVPVYWNASDL